MGSRLIAIASLAAFYGCYFGKMLCQKRRGIQTDQLGKGKDGFVKAVEVTMKLAAVLTVAAELVSIVMGTGRSPAPVQIIGAVMCIVGTAVFIAAVLDMRDSWRAGVSKTDQTVLVTDGIYRFSRNPAFLGFDFLYFGILCMFWNWVLCAATVFAVFMYHLQIVYVEEPFLFAAFGEEYFQYQKKVCRYMGRKR